MSDDIKMVIVCRKDLNMRKGKMVAQSCHAVLNVFLNRGIVDRTNDSVFIPLNKIEAEWLYGTSTKICVGVNSKEELLSIHENAKEKGLPIALVEDMGFTEFHGVPTLTCLAIGPAKSEEIDVVTGHLSLL